MEEWAKWIEQEWEKVADRQVAQKEQGGAFKIANPEEYKAHLRKELIKESNRVFSGFSERLSRGFEEIWEEFCETSTPEEKAQLEKEIKESVSFIKSLGAKDEKSLKHFEESNSLRELMNLSEESVRAMYKAACSLHQKEKLATAADAFYALCVVDPLVHAFWMGYAHCEGQTANHKAALHAYAVAAVTNSKNPLPHLFSATSYLELSELDEARQSLDLAIEIAEGQQEYAYVKKEAEKQKSFILGR